MYFLHVNYQSHQSISTLDGITKGMVDQFAAKIYGSIKSIRLVYIIQGHLNIK